MPTISRFFGILIQMYYNDHNPPHFHIQYGEFQATIGIVDFALLTGNLPPKVLGMVVEWASIHQSELINNWNLASNNSPLLPVLPLT
jgi:hypothetical protein